MKILMCYLSEDAEYTSGNSLRRALENIGHKVITCGPYAGNYDGELLSKWDIKVYDRRIHPESYTYREILDKVGEEIDFILQLDPHFYFVGEKPKDIISTYYLVDIHRGGEKFREMALRGSFDIIFSPYKYFMPLLLKKKLNCFLLPRAYDDLYIKEYDDAPETCDLTFCGETGLHREIEIFSEVDQQLNRRYHRGRYPNVTIENRYLGFRNSSFEYAARAEILIRLSRDFDLHVYEKTHGPAYAKIICKGKITVNHSLYLDSALRNFEVMACNRLLITDELPYQEELFRDHIHCRTYRNYYQPQFQNFNLDYECIKELVEYYLTHEKKRKEIALRGKLRVEQLHSFKKRAERITEIVDAYRLGNIEQIDRFSYF